MKKSIFVLLALALILAPLALAAAPSTSIGKQVIAASYPMQAIVQGDITANSPILELQLGSIAGSLAAIAKAENRQFAISIVLALGILAYFFLFPIFKSMKPAAKVPEPAQGRRPRVASGAGDKKKVPKPRKPRAATKQGESGAAAPAMAGATR